MTIDPEGSVDLDQAFCAIRKETGYRVWYAISDVASLVSPGGQIDQEARTRGVTLYSPDKRATLHPELINEGAGSLLADQDRRALLWTIDLDPEGAITSARLERANVRNRAQLSYREAQNRITGVDPDHPLALLREIGELRTRLEAERGAVSLQLPTQEVVETNEERFELRYDEPLPVESWNAQISLMTGIAASRIMVDAGVGLLRTLPAPDGRTVAGLRRTARALVIEWPDAVGYAEMIRNLRPDTPETVALLAQSARGLRGAGYMAFRDHVPEWPEHSAIASTYAHVTAPLRRLCDRFANEIVVAACADRDPPEWAVAALDDLPSTMGRASQKDRTLERAVVDFVEALILEQRIGERFTGVVTDVEDDHARVQIRTPAVVAEVPGEGFELGETVELELVAAEPAERALRFSRV